MSAGSGVIHPSGRHQRGGPHPGVSHLTRIDTSTPRFGYRGGVMEIPHESAADIVGGDPEFL